MRAGFQNRPALLSFLCIRANMRSWNRQGNDCHNALVEMHDFLSYCPKIPAKPRGAVNHCRRSEYKRQYRAQQKRVFQQDGSALQYAEFLFHVFIYRFFCQVLQIFYSSPISWGVWDAVTPIRGLQLDLRGFRLKGFPI